MHLVCSGCDQRILAEDVLAFSCPNRGNDDRDHVLRATLSDVEVRDGWPTDRLDSNDNPFIRYRKLSYSWYTAVRHGLTDREYIAIVTSLSDAIAEVDCAIRITPMVWNDSLDVTIKNETVNVSGSHKARHLIGTAIHMAVAKKIAEKTNNRSGKDIVLAIASCGNAALAAAVVAKAAQLPLQVYIPPSADQNVIKRLDALGAEQIVCERRDEDPAGDPCYLRFREAVSAGALPFSCQGGDNALALVGGHTLGWEIIEQLLLLEGERVQHLFIQVGGGALASSIVQAMAMAESAGIFSSPPTIHAVQTVGTHPLARAWKRLQSSGNDLLQARTHRSEFMWPWESVPESIASGILDDETYDWYSILEGLTHCSGSVVTVTEESLQRAQQLAEKNSDISVDATGTSGFAGLLTVRDSLNVLQKQRSLVLFTGAKR